MRNLVAARGRRRTAALLALGAVTAIGLAACGDGAGPRPSGGSGAPASSGPSGATGATEQPTGFPAGTVVVGGQAALAPEPGREHQLGCALSFSQLPPGRATVWVETIGLGAGADVEAAVGQTWDDGRLAQGSRDDAVTVFETIDAPAGDYACRVLDVSDEQGSIPFDGEITTTDSKAVAPEAVIDFIVDFPRAVREDDQAFLLDSLNPAVIERYGSDECSAFLADGFADPSFAMALERVRGPKGFAYASDGASVTVPDTWELRVTATSDAGTGTSDVHYAQVQDHLTWFTDCGDPL